MSFFTALASHLGTDRELAAVGGACRLWVGLYGCGWGCTVVGGACRLWVGLYSCGWGCTVVGGAAQLWVGLW